MNTTVTMDEIIEQRFLIKKLNDKKKSVQRLFLNCNLEISKSTGFQIFNLTFKQNLKMADSI